MHILICPDKFKGSLTAREVCESVGRALTSADPNAVIESVPLADGGEGTCDLLTEYYDGKQIQLQVHGPLFAPVAAHYGLSKDGSTAFVEMAVASGLMLLKPEERNPLLTTTLGTGEMIADAIQRNVRKVILGIGGSATNDAGIGMATALGFKFLDAGGEALKPTGENLIHIQRIDSTSVNPLLKGIEVIALCDVVNPLYGPDGAAYVYGPQKGADDQAMALLDAGLRNFRRVVHKQLKTSVDFPGAGAAGGLGAGARVFLNAIMQKGVHHIIESTGLRDRIKRADVIITGEGRIDSQTFSGKVVSQVITLAAKAGKPVVAVCGQCDVTGNLLVDHGIAHVISLVDQNTSSSSAIQNASNLLTQRVMEQYNQIRNV